MVMHFNYSILVHREVAPPGDAARIAAEKSRVFARCGARRSFVIGLRAARDVGDRLGEGLALDDLGVVHRRRSGPYRAGRPYRQSRRLAEEAPES